MCYICGQTDCQPYVDMGFGYQFNPCQSFTQEELAERYEARKKYLLQLFAEHGIRIEVAVDESVVECV
ncbi:hypothetical protein [Bacillus solitudinis]|uniref:hypothetical protein n=1 Tax=Bacillus solitudinis TaxID=2014074 RepID=UPI000C241B8F|nr:hypothetical protein [Bacillus solitudinis]